MAGLYLQDPTVVSYRPLTVQDKLTPFVHRSPLVNKDAATLTKLPASGRRASVGNNKKQRRSSVVAATVATSASTEEETADDFFSLFLQSQGEKELEANAVDLPSTAFLPSMVSTGVITSDYASSLAERVAEREASMPFSFEGTTSEAETASVPPPNFVVMTQQKEGITLQDLDTPINSLAVNMHPSVYFTLPAVAIDRTVFAAVWQDEEHYATAPPQNTVLYRWAEETDPQTRIQMLQLHRHAMPSPIVALHALPHGVVCLILADGTIQLINKDGAVQGQTMSTRKEIASTTLIQSVLSHNTIVNLYRHTQTEETLIEVIVVSPQQQIRVLANMPLISLKSGKKQKRPMRVVNFAWHAPSSTLTLLTYLHDFQLHFYKLNPQNKAERLRFKTLRYLHGYAPLVENKVALCAVGAYIALLGQKAAPLPASNGEAQKRPAMSLDSLTLWDTQYYTLQYERTLKLTLAEEDTSDHRRVFTAGDHVRHYHMTTDLSTSQLVLARGKTVQQVSCFIPPMTVLAAMRALKDGSIALTETEEAPTPASSASTLVQQIKACTLAKDFDALYAAFPSVSGASAFAGLEPSHLTALTKQLLTLTRDQFPISFAEDLLSSGKLSVDAASSLVLHACALNVWSPWLSICKDQPHVLMQTFVPLLRRLMPSSPSSASFTQHVIRPGKKSKKHVSPLMYLMMQVSPCVGHPAMSPAPLLTALREWAHAYPAEVTLFLEEVRTFLASFTTWVETTHLTVKDIAPFLSAFVDGTMHTLRESLDTPLEGLLADITAMLHTELSAARSCRSTLAFVSAVLRDMGLDADALADVSQTAHIVRWQARPVFEEKKAKEQEAHLAQAKQHFTKKIDSKQASHLYSIEKVSL